jgi:hypothetical protein
MAFLVGIKVTKRFVVLGVLLLAFYATVFEELTLGAL